MIRRSWLTALICMAVSPTAYGQYSEYSAQRNGQGPQEYGQPGTHDVRPVRYHQDEMPLESNYPAWGTPASAADASRAVADQLRQQYQQPTASPPMQPASGPSYRPVSGPSRPLNSGGERNPYVVERSAATTQTNPNHFSEPKRDDSRGLNYDLGRAPGAPTPQYSSQPSPEPYFNRQNAADCDAPSRTGFYDDGFGSSGPGRFRERLRGGSDCPDGSCGTPQSRSRRFWDQCGRDVYTVVGTRWLYLRRDGADYKSLSYEAGMPSDRLLVEDANIGHQNGIEVFFVRQDQNGRGWESRYWGLAAGHASSTLGNMPVTQLNGLASIDIGPWGDVADLYNMADFHSVNRVSELHSFEWNLVNHASTCGSGNWLYRGILGTRVIRFRDRLDYSANSATNFGFDFDQVNYSLLTRNTFVGAQAGGSGEYCLTDKFRLGLGATAGVGQVFMDADQTISTSTGVLANHPGGGNFSYMNTANDLSMFGELDARVYYHLNSNMRLSAGYRFLGISGLALAQNQIPYAFTDVAELNSIKRDSGLILHGLSFGAEFSY